MAVIESSADFLLTVGVDPKLSLDEMQKGIAQLVIDLNKNPPKIQVDFDINKNTLTTLQTQINDICKKLDTTAAVKVTGGGTAQEIAKDTAATNANTQAKRANATATTQKTQADANSIATMKQRQTAEKGYLNTIIQLEAAIKKWTKAEHSKNAESREAYVNLKAEAEALRGVYNAYAQKLHPSVKDVELLTSSTNKADVAFKGIKDTITLNGDATKSLTDRVGGLAEKFNTWFSISQVIMAAYRAVRQMISNVVELDTAMTELKKVTDETDATYNQFLDNATIRAKNLGAALSDVVKASADFARLGFNIGEAEKLADAAIVYKNVGDGIEDISTASESIIATMQAYGVEANDVMSIVDKFNEVGNNYAISSKGVGDALLRSAAAMRAAGNDIDETIALVTAANTVVQDPEKVGTTMKTLSMYLRAAKTEAEDAGESTDGMASSVSELRSEILALTGNRVDIQIDEDTFKSTYKILQELSDVWDELSDISKANILEMVGGKRNSNVVAALLENFTIAEKAIKTSADSAGSALAENEKYLESIEGRLSIFKATFETFSANLFDSRLVKGVVDLGTALLNVLNKLEELHLLLPAIISSVMLYKSLKIAHSAVETSTRLNPLVAALVKEKQATEELSIAVSKLTIAEQKALVTKIQQAVVNGQLTDVQAQQILTTLGLAAADSTLTVANKTLAGSFKSLMASIPVWGWIALAISVVIDGVLMLTSAIDGSSRSLEDLETEYQSLNSTVTTAVSNYQNLKNSTEEIIPRFVELAQGVDEFGNKVSLTDEEYAEFLELNNKIAELFPELNLGMDEQGNAMLALSYSADTLTQSLNDLVEAERMATNETIAKTMGDTLDNINDTQKAYNKEITKTETELRKLTSAYNLVKEMGESYKWNSSNRSDRNPNRYKAANYKNALDTLGIEYTETEVDFNPTTRTYSNTVIAADIDWDALERQYANGAAGYNSTIEKYNNKINAQWEKLRKSTVAYAQLDAGFQELDTDMQTALTKIIGSINWEDTGLKKEDEIKDYLSENFLNPIYEAEPEVQNALLGLFQLKGSYDGGQLYVNEYKKTVDNIIADLEKSGLSSDAIAAIKLSIDSTGIDEDIKKVKEGLSGTADEIDAFFNELTAKELEFAVKIIEAEGSMSITELQQKIDEMRFQNADYIEPFDFTTFLDGIDSAVDGIDKLVSSMEKLKEGTALTKSQLMELVEQYPQLLKNANLFTDGSIEGQKNMLQAILDTYEAEYDAQIDTKIAELEATERVLNDQLALETQKANLIQEIENMSANGKLDQEEDLVNKISELNDLQGQNYVNFKDGELQVNEEALNDELAQGSDFGVQATENIWQPYAETIVASHEQGYSGGLKATNSYGTNLFSRLKNIASSALSAFGNAISDAMSGNWKGIGHYFSSAFGGGGTGVSGGTVKVNFGGSSVTVGGQDLDDWISDQKDASDRRIDAINTIKDQTVNSINNLKALKGLKLTDIYASKSGSGSGSKDKDKEDEENIFKTMYNYHKHLVAMEQETTAEFLKWLDDAYKAAYEQGEITLDEYYKYEEEVFKGMQELRDEAKDTLEELIEFRVDMLKQDIENEKDALDKKLDNLKEFYDKQKEMLQDQYDEEKRLEEQSEKRKAVSDIRAELSMLENDDSAWAQKRKLELQAELSDAEGELADFEKESALDKALNAIDEAYNSQEAQLEREMEALDEKLNDPNALYNQALNDIRNNSKNQLYYQMLMYNRQYGDGKDETVKELWESTYGALNEYEKMFGELYQGVDLKNETGYKPPSTTNSNTSSNKTSTTTTTTTTPKTEPKKEDKPSLDKGSYVKVKSGTRWYADSYGGGASGTAKAGTIKYINTKGSHPYNIDGLGWVKKSDIIGYASGTKHATAGLHELFEQGDEYIFSASDGSRYRMFSGGEKVLNAKATEFLYDFANSGGDVLGQMLKNVFGGTGLDGISPIVITNEINMGDIVVQGSADTRTVSEIRRAQRESVDFMLKEFTKLNK